MNLFPEFQTAKVGGYLFNSQSYVISLEPFKKKFEEHIETIPSLLDMLDTVQESNPTTRLTFNRLKACTNCATKAFNAFRWYVLIH